MATETDPAVSVCFAVTVDERKLGTFNSCEGLGCEVVWSSARRAATTPSSGSCRRG